jgi:hypothetical protein
LDRRGRAAGKSAKALATAEAAAGRFGQPVEPLQITQAIELAASVPWVSRRTSRPARSAKRWPCRKKSAGQSPPNRTWVASRFSDFTTGSITAVEAGDARTKTALGAKADQAERSRWLKKGQSGRWTDLVEGQSLDNPGWNATL